jgi:hypothetical protein
MKKVIFILALCFATSLTFAQQIDTTVKSIASVGIQPIKANFTDTDSSVFLGIRVIEDNLVSSANLYFCFLTSSSQVTFQGNFAITGEDYQKWCNLVLNPNYTCQIWPYVLVGQKYNLTFTQPNIPPVTGSTNRK